MPLSAKHCENNYPLALPGGLQLPSYLLIRITSADETRQAHPVFRYAGKVCLHTVGTDGVRFPLKKALSVLEKGNFSRELFLKISQCCELEESDIIFTFPGTVTFESNALYAAALALHESQADVLFFPLTVLTPAGEEVRMPLHTDGPACAERMRIIMDSGCFDGFPFPIMAIRRSAWLRANKSKPQEFIEIWDALCGLGARVHTIGAPLIRVGKGLLASAGENAVAVKTDTPRIAFVNDIGFLYGAGIAHRRLCDAVAMTGATIKVFALGPWRPRDKSLKAERDLLRQLGEFSPDYIICGNLHASQCNNSLLTQMLTRWPVAFCLHDLWLLTGHCPHPRFEACEKARSGCDASCPCPASYPPIAPEKIAESWRRNRQALSSKNLLPLANSSWTASEYLRYAPQAVPPHRIAMGCEDDIFVPGDTLAARHGLPVQAEDFVVFMPMCDFTSPYKGGKEGLEALGRLNLPHMKILCVGWQAKQATALSDKVVAVPYVNKPEDMARLFQASDVVVSFSHAETLGQTLIESAFCGVPSVAYAVTGLTDAVTDGISGILCEENPDAIAAQVMRLYHDKRLRETLGYYAALNARNTRSLFAEYKSLNDALEQSSMLKAHPNGFVRFRTTTAAESMPVFWANAPTGFLHFTKSVMKRVMPLPLWELLRDCYYWFRSGGFHYIKSVVKRVFPPPLWNVLRRWYHWSRR